MLHWLFIHSWNHAKTRYGSRPLIRKIKETIFLNGTKTPELTLRFSAPGVFLIRKLDCFGEIVHEETKALTASVHTFQVSQGGALFLYPSEASKSDVAIHS